MRVKLFRLPASSRNASTIRRDMHPRSASNHPLARPGAAGRQPPVAPPAPSRPGRLPPGHPAWLGRLFLKRSTPSRCADRHPRLASSRIEAFRSLRHLGRTLVKISDVARHAEVAPGAVSCALSGKRSIPDQTRRHVPVSARTSGGQLPGGQLPGHQIPGRQLGAGASAQASNCSSVIALVVPFRSGTRTGQLKWPLDGAAARNERHVGQPFDAARHQPRVTAREHVYPHS